MQSIRYSLQPWGPSLEMQPATVVKIWINLLCKYKDLQHTILSRLMKIAVGVCELRTLLWTQQKNSQRRYLWVKGKRK